MSMSTSVQAILKTLYPKGLNNLVIESSNDPFLKLVPKTENFFGYNRVLAWKIANGAGVSNVFANALANVSESTRIRPTLTRKSQFAIARVDLEDMIASQNSEGGITNLWRDEMASLISNLGLGWGRQIWANGGGAIARLASGTVGGTTLTLADPSKAYNFQPGMKLNMSDTDGTSGNVRAGSVTLAAVNYETGVLTATGNWTAGITAAANTDYLFRDGDFGTGLFGVAGWIPSADPTGTDAALGGIDRRAAPQLMAGVRYNDTASSPMESLGRILANHSKYGTQADTLFIPPANYGILTNEVTNLQRFESKGGTMSNERGETIDAQNIMVGGVIVNGPRGQVKVLAAPNMPTGEYFLTKMDSWELSSMGPLNRSMTAQGEAGGNEAIVASTVNSLESRWGGWAQLFCKEPIQSQRGTIANWG